MMIEIYPPRRWTLDKIATKFALQQNDFNDYWFYTNYQLYYQPDEPGSALVVVGPVRILRAGQKVNEGLQVTKPFYQLGDEFCSLGATLDYYQRLSELPLIDRKFILTALRDVVANPFLVNQFNQEEGWRVALFRDNKNHADYLADANAIYTNNYTAIAEITEPFEFTAAGWGAPLHLDFDTPAPPFEGLPPFRRTRKRAVRLPRRIIALIGRNGSGKSTLLARIARVAFASSGERAEEPIKSIGAFEPPSIGFMRVIAISYSAFDNFVLPGSIETELQQIASDVERGSGRFVYAGLRDVVAEARADVEALKNAALTRDELKALSSDDRRKSTRLKSLDQLADEFVRLLEQIEADGKEDLLDRALEPLLNDASFVDVEGNTREAVFGTDVRAAFLSWSTGHKIAMHVIASLVSHATRKSIVLFDEPETHLHPPLTAALLNAVRIVLEETNAFAIVATHSPVILQETLARHVRIVTRVGDRFQIDHPLTETFGENVGLLTQGIFGLTSASTDFHHVLDFLIKGCSTVEEVDQCFTPGLSGQALAYVMAGFARKEKQP